MARSRQRSLPGMEDDSAAGGSSPPVAATVKQPPPHDLASADPTATPDGLRGRTVWVIDAMSLIFQVFHAIPEMTGAAGQPVNAIFGFARDLFQILEQKQPDYLFCAFDTPEPTFRHVQFAEYKGTRAEMPPDLAAQLDPIRQVVTAMGIPVLECPGYEADDILAMLAVATERAGGDCYLVTADKDCRQLISEHVRLFNVRKNQLFDAAALAEDWGVRPDQVVDFQSLVGDAVDNIPGVPLIGPKIARELLGQYDTLDNLLAHAGDIAQTKRRQNLQEFGAQALASRKLARLEPNVPLTIDWPAGRAGQLDAPRLDALFQQFSFRSLREKVSALAKVQAGTTSVAAPTVSGTEYRTVDTPAALDALVALLGRQTQFSLDTETTSLHPRAAEIVGYSFACEPGMAYYVPVRGPVGERVLDPATTLAALRPVLENAAIEKVGQNLKYDLIVLRSAGVRVAGVAFDTMIASYLLEAGQRNHNLDDLALRYLDHTTIKIESLIGSGKEQKSMADVPIAQITAYAAEDAEIPWRLRPILAPKLEAEKLTELFAAVEMPLVDVLAEMEFTGIRVDVPRLRELSATYGARLTELEGEIHALAGRTFNIASPKQLQEILFTEQKLPVLKRTKTGPSTDADVLEELARQHPLPAKIIEYRQYAKLKNTYVDALPQLVHPGTGRVHASFNQVVAATGRLSSSEPNLQNIPIRTETGREIRSAFIPGEPGWMLLAADYSQIELRVLAHFCQDETLRAAFLAEQDIHARVAAEVHGVPLDAVTPEQRRTAKAVNFGIIYGQSAFGLAKTLDIDQDAAAKFIEAYFARYPGVERFMNETLEFCAQHEYVTTILGRRRAISGVRPAVAAPSLLEVSAASRQKNLSERTAINTVIQGSAADLIKLAMAAVARRLRTEGLAARMLLQIHDELVFECPREELEPLRRLVLEEMTGAMSLTVPLVVDIKTGATWAECEK